MRNLAPSSTLMYSSPSFSPVHREGSSQNGAMRVGPASGKSPLGKSSYATALSWRGKRGQPSKKSGQIRAPAVPHSLEILLHPGLRG